MQIPRQKWIYKKSDRLTSFFIILWGKVKIVNCEIGYKKASVQGETLSEQVIFMGFSEKSTRDEGAKASSDCFLLEV